MSVVYQTVKWNVIFEVMTDGENYFVFRNGRYHQATFSLEDAKGFCVNIN